MSQNVHQELKNVDSSQEIELFTSHNIGPRSESELDLSENDQTNKNNVQYGYLLTNVNFAALPDCVSIENVGSLCSINLN